MISEVSLAFDRTPIWLKLLGCVPAFPVIDRWTVDAVYGAPVAASAKLWHRSSVYAHFAEQLVTRREDFPNAMNIHRLDQAGLSKAMSCNHADRPCDCFPTWPVEVP